MINKQKLKNHSGSHSLPAEIIERLESLHRHTTLPQQTMTFSVDLPCGNGKRLRWNRKLKQLTLPHIISSSERGEEISLFVLHQASGQVLSLRLEKSVWRRVSSKPLTKAEQDVPNRHRHSTKRWFRKSATSAQMKMLGKILNVELEELPQITAYNANLILSTYVLMPHMDRIQTIINLWIPELGQSPATQMLPFAELESA